MTLEHIRSVYGSGEVASQDSSRFMLPLSSGQKWSQRFLSMPSSVISFLAVAVIAVVIVLFVILNLVTSSRRRRPWRSQGTSSTPTLFTSHARYRKVPDRDQDMTGVLLASGDEENEEEIVFERKT